MCRIFLYIFLCFAFIGLNSYSQNNQTLESIIENSVDQLESNTDPILYPDLHPISINQATYNEIQELGVLSDLQILRLLNHIKRNGKLVSKYELQAIEGFDLETIKKLLPLIKIESDYVKFSESLKHGNNLLITRLETRLRDTLFAQNNFNGSSEKIYSRYRYYNNQYYSLGITTEKDAGEAFFNKTNNKGFDFYSSHLFIKNVGFFKALCIGDYQIGFGQGLIAGYSFKYKSSDVINVKQSIPSINPYTSVDENRFKRGASITLKYKKMDITSFVSYKKVDANATKIDSLNNQILEISSLKYSGYHRSEEEIVERKNIRELVYGASINYKNDKLTIALNNINTALSAKINPIENKYNQNYFSSDRLFNTSLSYDYKNKNYILFGEFAVSDNLSKAFINGILVALDKNISFAALYRNYEKSFHAIHAVAFSEGSRISNENGIYLGVDLKLTKQASVSAYYDYFRYPWLSSSAYFPTQGNDCFLQFNLDVSKNVNMYFRYRYQDKNQNNNSLIATIISPFLQQKNTFRYHISYKVHPNVTLKNRVEFKNNSFKNNNTNGFLIYQDILFKKQFFPLAFSLRYAIFDTDSYDTRIYAYENDLYGIYSIEPYYYNGSLFYGLVTYDITKQIELGLKYTYMLQENEDIKQVSQFKIQVSAKF